eukprot:IDg5833t1
MFFLSNKQYTISAILLGPVLYSVAENNTASIKKEVFLETRTQLGSYLGMCNVYR